MAVTGRYQSREIFAKAVCGKGHKYVQSTHKMKPAFTPVNILGAWVMNHSYEAKRVGDVVEVIGSYDINVWYAYDKNTKTEIAKETVSYVEHVPLSSMDANMEDEGVEVIVTPTLDPNCVEASLSPGGDYFFLEVEKEFMAEVIAETRLRVLVIAEEDDLVDKDLDLDFEEEQDEADAEEADILLDDLD